MGKRRIEESLSVQPIQYTADKTMIEEKLEEKLKIKEKIKKLKLKNTNNASITVLCKVKKVLPHGYLLKLIERPINRVNINYGKNDEIEYPTFNTSYDVGDIIEYSYIAPATRHSKLIKKVKDKDDKDRDDKDKDDKDKG